MVHFIKGYMGVAPQQVKTSNKSTRARSTRKSQPCLLQDLTIGGNHISMTASVNVGTTQPAPAPLQFS